VTDLNSVSSLQTSDIIVMRVFSPADGSMDALYRATLALREMEDLLEVSLGFRRRASETPLEFLGRARSGNLPGAVGGLLEMLVHEICRGLYDPGGDPRPSDGKLSRLLAGLRESVKTPPGGPGP
jgi:hypothetical protein